MDKSNSPDTTLQPTARFKGDGHVEKDTSEAEEEEEAAKVVAHGRAYNGPVEKLVEFS